MKSNPYSYDINLPLYLGKDAVTNVQEAVYIKQEFIVEE